MLSAGHKKDLLVLHFAHSCLRVSEESYTKDDEDLIKLDNKSYKTNKKIKRELDTLKSSILSYLESIMDTDTARWIKKNGEARTMRALNITVDKDKYSLEFLALWVLYVNFIERKLPLHNTMNFLKEYDYLTLANFLDKTSAHQVTTEMMFSAYDIVAVLKA